jgi:hypothetical protein
VHFIASVTAARPRAAGGVLVALVLSLVAAAARARPATADCSERPCSYAVSFELTERFATRRDFARPIFLVQHPIDELRAHELALKLDVWLALLLGFGLEFRLPVLTRHAAVHYAPVLVSLDQTAKGSWHEMSATGLGDPSVVLDYRLIDEPWLAGTAGLGVRIPEDDNPGNAVVPDRVPLSTGQREWFLEAELAAWFEPVSLELAYHLAYHPGDAASYLVRHVGPNQVASGVLGDFWSHELALDAGIGKRSRFWAELTPRLKIEENPPLVQGGQELTFLPERGRLELGVRASFGARLSASHSLELFGETPLTRSFERDPFFPIAMPARGFGVVLRMSGP